MKIALLSNVTSEVLAGMLAEDHSVWTPPGYGAWMETALEPPQELVAFGPDVIGILIDRRFGTFDPEVQRVNRAVESLRAAFPGAAVIAPDLSRLAADFGERFYDERMWKLGKMPFSLVALRELAKLFAVRKVLALDLDNTLWKGVVGEDGTAGVQPDAMFQEELRALESRGVLLAVLSKNNPEDVRPMWADARMRLRADDFVAMAIDWNEKADNLVRMAEGLNLGIDSFVFVDDDPAERAAMRARLPEVAVAGFPPQLDVYFPLVARTAEDEARTAMYRAEAKRREFGAGLAIEDYLSELGIWTDIHAVRPDEVPRIAQLSQKANQFNVCTNRYAESEIAGFLEDERRLAVSVRSGDRFGDYGLVAFVQAVVTGDSAEIVDWVMSCRAMNRRLEFGIEEEVERRLALRGVCALTARWQKTTKNAPVEGLFDKLGFSPVHVAADCRTYLKRLV